RSCGCFEPSSPPNRVKPSKRFIDVGAKIGPVRVEVGGRGSDHCGDGVEVMSAGASGANVGSAPAGAGSASAGAGSAGISSVWAGAKITFGSPPSHAECPAPPKLPGAVAYSDGSTNSSAQANEQQPITSASIVTQTCANRAPSLTLPGMMTGREASEIEREAGTLSDYLIPGNPKLGRNDEFRMTNV